MAAPSQRRALGALFVALAGVFAGITVATAAAATDDLRLWPVALAAAAIAVWLASLAVAAFRR